VTEEELDMDSGVEDDDISLSEGSMDEKVFAK